MDSKELTHLSEEDLIDISRAAYKRSLWHTANDLCGLRDMTHNTHMPMIRALEAPTLRKLICVPRGTFKSSVVSVAYAIWVMIREPNCRILLDADIYKNAKDLLKQVKGILTSNEFIEIFGDWRTDTWNEGEIIISPRTKNLRSPTITVGGITTSKVGQHYTHIIADDYNTADTSSTPEQRKKVIEHYQMNQAILDPGGVYCIVGTRYHEDDLIGWVLRNELGLKGEEDLDFHNQVGGVYEF